MTTTARTIRMAAWLVCGAAIAAALGAGAAAMADEIRSSPSVTPPARTVPAVSPSVEPEAAAETPSPGPAVSASPSLSPSPSAAPPAPKTFLNMRTVQPSEAITFQVPSGLAHCPAATVPLKGLSATVDGVAYRIQGDATSAFTDLTGDGRDELIMAVECGVRGRTLLVFSATGPAAFATIAARDISALPTVARLTASNGIVTTYDVLRPVDAASDVRTYLLRGREIVQVSVAPKPAEWQNATITMPAVASCPAGSFTFAEGHTAAVDGQSLRIHADAVPLYVDVDRDGTRETLLHFECVVGTQVTGSSVFALTTTGAKAGRVFATVLSVRAAEQVSISGYTAGRDKVGLMVGRLDPKTGQVSWSNPFYRWSGTGFVAVS